MNISQNHKDHLVEIIQYLISGDTLWFSDKNIDVKDKGDCWILNYKIGVCNDYNKLTRGLVVQKPIGSLDNPLSLILSFPFVRFFNLGEGPADTVDFSNAEMIEKLDGTLVGIYQNGDCWHTRKMVSSNKEDMNFDLTTFHGKSYKLMPLIGQCVDKIKFSDSSIIYICEFIHEATFVVTRYNPDQYGLYLVGARSLDTLQEFGELELDKIAHQLGLKRPRRWDSTDDKDRITDLMEKIKEQTPGFEGFVFRDRITGNRVKIKDVEYVRIHHMVGGLTYKNLLYGVLHGETSEILSYFASAQSRIDEIRAKCEAVMCDTLGQVVYWRDKNLDRKSLAIQIFHNNLVPDKWVAAQIMSFFQESNDEAIKEHLEQQLLTMSEKQPNRLLKILGLKDQDEGF